MLSFLKTPSVEYVGGQHEKKSAYLYSAYSHSISLPFGSTAQRTMGSFQLHPELYFPRQGEAVVATRAINCLPGGYYWARPVGWSHTARQLTIK